MTIKEYIKQNKKDLNYKDFILYDYECDNKIIINKKGFYWFNDSKRVSKNIIKYYEGLTLLMSYNEGGVIFLQVNY